MAATKTTPAAAAPPRTNGSSPAQTSPPDLDESSLSESLARLHEVHVALRNLRQSIPALLASTTTAATTAPAGPQPTHPSPSSLPTSTPTLTPSAVYTSFSHTATATLAQIQGFETLMRDSATGHAFEVGKRSRERDPETGVWDVNTSPGWWWDGAPGGGERKRDVTKEEGGSEGKMEVKVEGVGDGGADGEQGLGIEEVIAKFRTRCTDQGVSAEMEAGDEGKGKKERIRVSLAQPTMAGFWIEKPVGDEGAEQGKDWTVTSASGGKIAHKIAEVVAARTKGKALGHLLDMLAAYRDFKSRQCDKCARLVDRNGDLPLLRVETPADKKEHGERTWRALHRTCV